MRDELKHYHHWVEWSDEDACFIGYCPDLSSTGMCHGSDPVAVYRELLEVMNWFFEDAIEHGERLPSPTPRQQLVSA